MVVSESAAIYGMGAVTGQFRINIGVVNLDPNAEQTFLIESLSGLFGRPPSATSSVAVPPMSMQQVSIVNPAAIGGFGAPVIVSNRTPGAAQSKYWTAYGSTIDNVTGDGFSQLAINRAIRSGVHCPYTAGRPWSGSRSFP
jgi:hypothetical protein